VRQTAALLLKDDPHSVEVNEIFAEREDVEADCLRCYFEEMF
jgi:hypothetical protein